MSIEKIKLLLCQIYLNDQGRGAQRGDVRPAQGGGDPQHGGAQGGRCFRRRGRALLPGPGHGGARIVAGQLRRLQGANTRRVLFPQRAHVHGAATKGWAISTQ